MHQPPRRHRARIPLRGGPVAPPRLVLLNGPPGIGKSTIAGAYGEARAGSLVLDVDEIRGRRVDWRAMPYEAGLLARSIALASAREHLQYGGDVVVAQYVARPEFLDQLATVATEAGAAFHELCLLDNRAASLARFALRDTDPSLAEHHRDCIEQAGGLTGIAGMYDALLAFLATRATVVLVATDTGGQARALAAVLAATA